MPGVVRTRVGYAGGTLKDPTYHNLGDHSETIQIDYDPAKINYAQILNIFWSTHNACRSAWSRQYMSAIFYANDEQKKIALETKEAQSVLKNRKVFTEVLPLDRFYLAEDYHQKYALRSHAELMQEFTAMYPNDADFVNSTAAARVNSIVSGEGFSDVKDDIPKLGLSEAAQQKLLRMLKTDSSR